ncbi:hypothetical protein DSO57_1036341 [Entomophthora muscae]|uniref:Uncharacterized protein n=1 Tax=Entomophthora muscae TaxID=34485 RepID=A0ACC2TLD5_9FUNG|nr:hypothetical protein DSO57_1036341 [Entomophthora muscae]
MLKATTDILNQVSTVSAIAVLLLVVTLGRRRQGVIQRTSIRLQTGIAACNLVRHLLMNSKLFTAYFISCNFVEFTGVILLHVFVVLNVAITVNLQRLFLQKKNAASSFLKRFLVCAAVVVAAVNLYLAFGFIPSSDGCSFKEALDSSQVVNLCLVIGPPLLSFDYCLILPLWILYKSSKKENTVKALEAQADFQEELLLNPRQSQVQFSNDQIDATRKLIHTSVMYPLAFCLTAVPDSVYHTFQHYGQGTSSTAESFIRIGHCSAGLLYMLVFLNDPIIKLAIQTLLLPRAPQSGSQEEFSLGESSALDFFATFFWREQPTTESHHITKLFAQNI